MRKFIAAPVVACGLLSAPIPFAGEASAFCDSADCVPNVARNVAEGAPCTPGPSYVFGLDSNRNTLICAAQAMWVRVGPLIGTRELALPCDQQPWTTNDLQARTPGVPLKCAEINGAIRWIHF